MFIHNTDDASMSGDDGRPVSPGDLLFNNVVRRNQRDLVMNGFATALILIMPVATLIALSIAMSIEDSPVSELKEYSSIVIMMPLILEALIAMFMARTMYTRLSDHSERDAEWRNAIIRHVRVGGLDPTELERIDAGIRKKERFRARGLINIILFSTLLFITWMFVYGIPSKSQSDYDAMMGFAMAWGAVACVLTFMMIVPKALGFAYVHEKGQSRFTVALSETLARSGVRIRPMAVVVGGNKPVLHIILLYLTAGAWSLYLLFRMFRSMNDHLMNQWMYEENLLSAIISDGERGFEDGIYQMESIDRKRRFKKKLYRYESKHSARRTNRMPGALVLAELFLLVVCATYILNIIGLVCDLTLDHDMFMKPVNQFIGFDFEEIVWNDLRASLLKMGSIAMDLVFLLMTTGSLLGIASRRLTSWRKVTRCCVTFTAPLFLSLLMESTSYTRLFTLDPFITGMLLLGMMLMMILSRSIREFYAPVGAPMPALHCWVIYILCGSLEPEDASESI